MKVVIIENEFITQLHLQSMISSMGHHVCGCASNYHQAIEVIESSLPDIILVDIGLEGNKSGIDLVNYLKKRQGLYNIIFVTANFDKHTLNQAIETNPLGVIQKPFENSDFKIHFSKFTESLQIN